MTMKNLNIALLDFNGDAVKDRTGKEITIRTCCINALNATFPDEQGISGEEKVKRFQLAIKISTDSEVDLKSEEIVELKKVIGKGFDPLTVGRVYALLDC